MNSDNSARAAEQSISGGRRLPRVPEMQVMKCLKRACTLAAAGDDSRAIACLTRHARKIEADMKAVRASSFGRLPSVGKEARVMVLARSALRQGNLTVTAEKWEDMLAKLAARECLRMEEIWALPAAVRIAALEGLAAAAQYAVQAAEDAHKARVWLADTRASLPAGCSDAFYACALSRAASGENARKHAMLLEQLEKEERLPERVTREARENQALLVLRIENLLATVREADRTDWQGVFCRVSRVQQMLCQDPEGIYGAMDEHSQALVRACVAELARAMRLPEIRVAEGAVLGAAEYPSTDTRATVCWWLYDDDGRAALCERLCPHQWIKRKLIVPDADGRRFVLASGIAFLLTLLLFAAGIRKVGPVILAIPAAWAIGNGVLRRVLTRLIPPRPLLKLCGDTVPDSTHVLVVMPVLISSAARGAELARRLEAHGALCRKKTVEFLLLGDFRDAPHPHEAEDAAILTAVRAEISRMNHQAGWEKYHLLHRERTLVASDGVWMGHERKRGALQALNTVLTGGGSEFAAEGACAPALRGRFRYVITLDADTVLSVGAIGSMVGAMRHPLNELRTEGGRRKGYAVLQPRMETAPWLIGNAFSRLYAAGGGADVYPADVSDVYQDFCARGSFGGKGIYDVRAFSSALAGKLPEHLILSHDLIEGIFARAGALPDVVLFEGVPAGLSGHLKRLERWTRGDWQLVRFLFRRELDALDRFKIADNLLRSLMTLSVAVLLLGAMWTANPGMLLMALLPILIPALFAGWDRSAWRRALLSLALVPYDAATSLAAIGRALWRQTVSGRFLLRWVTAADAEEQRAGQNPAGMCMAILLLPAMVHPSWAVGVIGFVLLYAVSAARMRDLGADVQEARLSAAQVAALLDLAARTWRFFARNVGTAEKGLPPDNVQLDPQRGSARRTSPTNIGMYLVACLAARELGFLAREEMLARLTQTISAVETLPKWRGNLFNWYDIDDRTPLAPVYVSSVDSGNFVASAMLVAAGLQTMGEAELAERLEKICQETELFALYDARQKLFSIGYDPAAERPSLSHYDLLASESRILSFVAIALGQVPPKHWQKLGRGMVRVAGGQTLVSWSGTMFEYMMPELFMHASRDTLLAQAQRAMIHAQVQAGADHPWGISEAAYDAFDASLNYQYRAFGLPEAALSGEPFMDVVAPYASCLALCRQPERAAENIVRMLRAGWADEEGFYESVDFRGGDARVVKTHMAHHQGMILMALCNMLTKNRLAGYFAARPEVRAHWPLLAEKPCRTRAGVLGSRLALPARTAREEYVYAADMKRPVPETQVFSGGGATLFLTADGRGYFRKGSLLMNRFAGDLMTENADICLHPVEDTQVIPYERVVFDAGGAVFYAQSERAEYVLTITVSPENGALYQLLTVRNKTDEDFAFRLELAFDVALCSRSELCAHRTFRNLFVKSARNEAGGITFCRRAREQGEEEARLDVLLSKVEKWLPETDRAVYYGRQIENRTFRGTLGGGIDPICALRAEAFVAGGMEEEIAVMMAITAAGEISPLFGAPLSPKAAHRARQLAGTQVETLLRQLAISAEDWCRYGRTCAFLEDAGLLSLLAPKLPGPYRLDALWSLGISGDVPIVICRVTSPEETEGLRWVLRLYELMRVRGVVFDLVVFYQSEPGYAQPLRDRLVSLVQTHCGQKWDVPVGGVRVLEEMTIAEETRRMLARAAALPVLDGGEEGLHALDELFCAGIVAQQAVVPCAESSGTLLAPMERSAFNGWGGLTKEGTYVIDGQPGRPTPAPWVNIIAEAGFGTLVSERGGGFSWCESSYSGRLTRFENDAVFEGEAEKLLLLTEDRRIDLLPGYRTRLPYRTEHGVGYTRIFGATDKIRFSVMIYVDAAENMKCTHVHLENATGAPVSAVLVAGADWLMGTKSTDRNVLAAWYEDGMLMAEGTMEGVGFLSIPNLRTVGNPARMRLPADMKKAAFAPGYALSAEIELPADGALEADVLLGCARDRADRARMVQKFLENGHARRFDTVEKSWEARLSRLTLETPNADMNLLVNRFFRVEALSGRVFGRTGLYQPGGAIGFRDQLQDMLSVMYMEERLARRHILNCAAHQFEDGDVCHWWHPPLRGVRTRITDDLLFLPFVTAIYVEETGDGGILREVVPFLRNETIPENSENWYGLCVPSGSGTLHEHNLRAIFRAAQLGEHGLVKMGGGDWNDGMNLVGAEGRGESVWLTEFMLCVIRRYAPYCDAQQQRALRELEAKLRQALTDSAWDGDWYLRAYYDNGAPMGARGNSECEIDLIAQSWAALADLEPERVQRALDMAWEKLVDSEHGIIRLLTPPFEASEPRPGYIQGYPRGVRENGGQYTHAACWFVMALAHTGQAERAWQAYQMLLPLNHARTAAQAEIYRVEPYVVAADVYGEKPLTGRGGWTWYTGAAGWMVRAALMGLMGFEKRGNRVRVRALLPAEWQEAAVTVREGRSVYRLISRRETRAAMLDGQILADEWVELRDDARPHTAIFPVRAENTERKNADAH